MTVADIVTKFRRRFPDCSAASAIEYYNDAQKEILFQIPYAKRARQLNVQSGVQEYPLEAEELKVWSVRYVRSSSPGDYKELRATSEDELDLDRPGWRSEDPSEPQYFYIDSQDGSGGTIGTFPTSDTTSANGYPKLIIETSIYNPAENQNTPLPNIPVLSRTFVDLMCYFRACDKNPAIAPSFKAISDESLIAASHQFWGRNVQAPQKMEPAVKVRRGWRNAR